MPNYTYNDIYIKADEATITRIKTRASKGGAVFSFNNFIPERPNDPKYQNMKEKWGGSDYEGNENFNWYDWRVDNWGCKWDAGDPEIEELSPTELQITFRTPWDAPREFAKRFSKMYQFKEFEWYAMDEDDYDNWYKVVVKMSK